MSQTKCPLKVDPGTSLQIQTGYVGGDWEWGSHTENGGEAVKFVLMRQEHQSSVPLGHCREGIGCALALPQEGGSQDTCPPIPAFLMELLLAYDLPTHWRVSHNPRHSQENAVRHRCRNPRAPTRTDPKLLPR